MPDPFVILDPGRPDPSRLAAFDAQRRPLTLGSHEEASRYYKPDKALVTAANSAMTLGVPLLLTGEAGTGKTQLAYWVHGYLGLKDRLFSLNVQSTTTARDLLYTFDNVAYFHAANDRRAENAGPIDKWRFLRMGPLWRAFEPPRPRAVVLVDEIDKASREFPNDLLHTLDQLSFEVFETGHTVSVPKDAAPPLVIITSNSERRLPEPFLRRCIFHHIVLTEELVRSAVDARSAAFPALSREARDAALQRFFEIRDKPLRKKPATAELLVWLVLLATQRVTDDELRRVPLQELPALGALLKDRDDLEALR